MSSFTHQRNTKNRYNIYENHVDVIAVKSFYIPLRNSLFFIALILTLLVTSLISFDTYQNKENQLKENLFKSELTKVLSSNIIQQINADNARENINPQQLKLIIKKVMEKIENSPKQIIYTKQ